MLLENSKVGIQMAARIVDTPCNEMNTDAFLNEVNSFFDNDLNLRGMVICLTVLPSVIKSILYFTDPYCWPTLRHSTNNHSRPGAERKRIWRDLWCRSRGATSTSTCCIEPWADRRNADNSMGRERNCIWHWRSFYQGTDSSTSLFEL